MEVLVTRLPFFLTIDGSYDLDGDRDLLEGVASMEWIRRVFHVPATETQTGIVLALCIFAMSVMSLVLVWQAQVIAKQNAVIRMFESRFGG
jgi:hypothetical protein